MADRFWTPEEANGARDRVAELVRRAQAAVEALGGIDVVDPADVASNGHGAGTAERAELDAVLRELAEGGIVIKDLGRGLVDFPARSPSGRPYLICWLVDEPEVAWWHWPEDGFAGRAPLDQPPD